MVLSNDDGMLVLANRRAEDMFGCGPGELIGQPVESLVPAGLRPAHVTQRAGYAREPAARPMGSRMRLAGQRQDGSTFPARVSLSPVVTATGRFILAVIRDITEDRPQADLAELAEMARAAAAADDARRGGELLSQVVDGLFRVGLSLQAAPELPHEAAVQQIADDAVAAACRGPADLALAILVPLWQRVSIRVTEQFGQPGANCAGRPTVQVKRRIKQVQDGCLNLGQADWVGRGYQVDPQVAVDPGRQLRVVFGVKVECGTQDCGQGPPEHGEFGNSTQMPAGDRFLRRVL